MHWGHPNRDSVRLFLGDAVLITLAAAVAGWYVQPVEAGHATYKALSLLALLPAFLGAMYVCNLYNLAGINGLGTLVKVIVAVGAGSAFCNGVFHLFPWKNPSYWSLELCTLILPGAAYAWRRGYCHGCRFRTRENLVVVGSARDSEVLSAAMDAAHPRYNLIGVLCAEAGGAGTL